MSDERCLRGHPWTDENTRIGPNGQRACRGCGREYSARYRAPRIAARAAAAIAALSHVGLDGEDWRPVVGFLGVYEVSDRGRVRGVVARKRTFPGKVLAPGHSKDGYLRVGLYGVDDLGRSTHKVHRLVLEAFAGPRPAGHEVNHIDGNKTNNTLSNLEYVRRSENLIHAWRLGLRSREAAAEAASTAATIRRRRKEVHGFV